MLKIGLTGWGDHPDIYSPSSSGKDKLIDYSGHFPIVELDATFYAVQPERTISKWIAETPANFQFVVKAYQGITGHLRGALPFPSIEEMYAQFTQSLLPLQQAGKLAFILLQFPPWFDCTKEHVSEIRSIIDRLARFEIAVEFRHQSWYSVEYYEKTIAFLTSLNAIHSVCDEPQAGSGSIPLVAKATRKDCVLLRIHGRNVDGWLNTTGDTNTWRKVRYLYNYSDAELGELKEVVRELQRQSKEVVILFNNNSGGHAAQNAKRFQKLLAVTYESKVDTQLNLFEEDL